MNGYNININDVLRASLEHQEPSAAFEDIWASYSKNKGPILVYKRLAVLAAAVLVLIISTKNISSMNPLSSKVALSNKMEMRVSKGDSASIKRNNHESKLKEKVAMFSESKDYKSAQLDIAHKKSTKVNAKLNIFMGKPDTRATNEVMNSFVIWDNQNYYLTVTTVNQKDLGKVLGKIIKQTIKPLYNGEGTEFPVGTRIYEIRGESYKNVIATKLKGMYHRLVLKQ